MWIHYHYGYIIMKDQVNYGTWDLHSLLLVLIICKLELSTLVGFGFFGGVFSVFVCLFVFAVAFNPSWWSDKGTLQHCRSAWASIFTFVPNNKENLWSIFRQCKSVQVFKLKGYLSTDQMDKGVEKSEMRAYYAFPYWNMELEIDVKD